MDREKIIKGLEFTKAMITFNPSTGEDIEPENLNEENKTSYDACVGAITLLKEREPVKTKRRVEQTEFNVCGCCGAHLLHRFRFCPECGRAVKWDELVL